MYFLYSDYIVMYILCLCWQAICNSICHTIYFVCQICYIYVVVLKNAEIKSNHHAHSLGMYTLKNCGKENEPKIAYK